MKHRFRVASAVGVSALIAAAFVIPATSASASDYRPEGPSRVVFVQTDNTAGNQVVAYDRASDGTLTLAATYNTGGLGGQLVGSAVDHLASQGSLAFDARHNSLIAVNAGSNTISLFKVDGNALHLRQVISSGGTFPVSVTAYNNIVYVLNARDGGSIQGYRYDDGRLELVRHWNRPLGLDSTLTPEFTHSPGQVAFSPDGSQLLVTTKANTHSIDVFAISDSGRQLCHLAARSACKPLRISGSSTCRPVGSRA